MRSVPLRVLPPIPDLSEIPQEVVQDCLRLEHRINKMEYAANSAAILSMASLFASQLAHYNVTGDWAEGIARGNVRVVEELFEPVRSPNVKSPTPRDSVILIGISGSALGLSAGLNAGLAIDQANYDRKCRDFDQARSAAKKPASPDTSVFSAIEPVGLPKPIVMTDAEVIDRVFPSAVPTAWLAGAARFANNHPVVAVGVVAVGLIVVGTAIYFSGGAVLVFAL